MSRYSYEESQEIAQHNFSFDALIMAAARKADSYNAYALKMAFPDLWEELQQRYNAPGGRLEGETI